MSVLVTGGAGYIGSHTVLALRDADSPVVVLDNLSTGFEWAVPSGVPLIVGNVGDKALVARIIQEHSVDAIMHFAGSVVVPESIAQPLAYYSNNTVNSRQLIETAIEAGVRHFIFSSTAAVYGMPPTNPISESCLPMPMSPYGSSKLMTEIMLADSARAYDLSYVALRYFNVAGADPDGRSGQSTAGATHLIKVACETALGKRAQMAVFGTDYATPDGTCIRDYLHVSDLVEAHLRALSYLRRGGASTVLNCGYSKGYSVREVVDTVKRISGVNFAVEECGRRVGDPAVVVAASEKLRGCLDWNPRHDDLDAIVHSTLAWERELNRMREPGLGRPPRGGLTSVATVETREASGTAKPTLSSRHCSPAASS